MKKRSRTTVELTYGEKKALEKKYNKIMYEEKQKEKNKSKPKQEKPKADAVETEETVKEKKLPDDMYRYYYFLDVPAPEAFRAFCEVSRIKDRNEAVMLLYDKGIQNRKEIVDTVKRSTVEYREGIEEKFEFIKDKLKNNMFERLAK